MATVRNLHEHDCAPAPQRGAHQGRQGVSRALHLRDGQPERLLRHDARQVSIGPRHIPRHLTQLCTRPRVESKRTNKFLPLKIA
ncbi:Hypothetical predicted protein [Olea europaea subsp. europaea]|uniref:Uncharacterized protein n=1 Tax=Olea europaea subsp. europaea TaxID=158383 RepID=A0A8S0TSF9_OLEEU|nr:Hypothetical predicted protein [Olea europaea subsp. europaea]